MPKVYNTQFELLNISKNKTTQGSNYYSLQLSNKLTGEIIQAVYFGNTEPKKVLSIDTKITKTGNIYNLAIVPTHQCRDKKTGRFISERR